MKLAMLLSVVSLVVAAPQNQRTTTTPIPILEYLNQSPGNGNYQFRFRTGNDIHREEEGSLKEVIIETDGREETRLVNVVRGVIRYPKEDGTFYELSYVADEFGFRPISSDLPTAPVL